MAKRYWVGQRVQMDGHSATVQGVRRSPSQVYVLTVERDDGRIDQWEASMVTLATPDSRTCWTCGTQLTVGEYRTAVREVADETKRWCIGCHDRVEMSHAPLAIANMLRFVAGLPKVGPWATAERDFSPPDRDASRVSDSGRTEA